MARVSQKSHATLRMNPRVERFPVHEAPLKCRLDKRQQLLDATMVFPLVILIASILRMVTHDGSKSAKSARILSPLPSSVHDSTDPSSGCSSTKLNSFFARYTTFDPSYQTFHFEKRQVLLVFGKSIIILTIL
jgi:hypothetical protein